MAHILVKNISANVFAQIVNSITTFVLVPLYLSIWGVQLYGIWLVLVAIPTMFAATADAGFVPVTGNDIAMRLARGKHDEVISLFQSSWLFVTAISIVIMGGAGAVISIFGIRSLLDIPTSQYGDARDALILLLVLALINCQNGIAAAALRGVGRMAEATLTGNLVVLAESSAIACTLLIGGSLTTIALIMLTGRVIAFITSRILLYRYVPWLKYGVSQARRNDIQNLFFPSVSFLFFPLGNAALLQGVVVVIGHTLGPVSVALFSTTRTVANIMIQAISLFSWASWPEISRQFGLGRRDQVAAYLIHGMQLAAIISIGIGLILLVGAPIIFSVWTAGRIEADRSLVALLVFASTLVTLRAFPSSILLATNQHVRYGVGYLFISLAVVAVTYLVLPVFGIRGAAAAVVVGEAINLILSMAFVLALIGKGSEPLKRILTMRPPLERLFMRR